MKKRQKYRSFVCVLLAAAVAGLGYGSWAALRGRIPEQITVTRSGETPEFFPAPLSGLISETILVDTPPVLLEAESRNAPSTQLRPVSETGALQPKPDSYRISYTLLGKIPLKTVSAQVKEPTEVSVGGTPIGIYLQTDGVLVAGTGTISSIDGTDCCPAQGILESGDYITSVNGTAVSTKEELIDCIGKCKDGALTLEVERDGELLSLAVTPVQDEGGVYRAGVWVRNDTQGIGTLTYIDDEGRFGALGHGISDIDTGELLKIVGGTLYDAEVISVVRGTQGTPGELAGVIHYEEGYQIGTIEENSQNGIYGVVSGYPLLAGRMRRCEIAYRQEVEEGAAVILSTVDGTCREYEVEIEEVRLNGKDINKGMVLRVTDPELLAQTGGIVQGMSGSPILQNGRLIGAVTHVFVQDSARGYGIFIEDMQPGSA